MTLSANDVIKSKIEGVEDIFNDRITTIKTWLQDQVDELAGQCGGALKEFLDAAAATVVSETDLTPLDEDIIFKTEKFRLSYIYSSKGLGLYINGPFPNDINQAALECSLIDNPELLSQCNDIEFVVINRKGTIIDTKLYVDCFNTYEKDYQFQIRENHEE